MERFFMTRTSAIGYLVKALRATHIEHRADLYTGSRYLAGNHSADLQQLLLDVRAGRVVRFAHAGPPAIDVFVTG